MRTAQPSRRAWPGVAARPLQLCLAAFLLLALAPGWSGQERYDYDPLGRLVRHTDAAGQVTDYQYDPAGNLLSVSRAGAGGAQQAPLLESVAPAMVRLGETRNVTLTGQRLRIGELRTSDPGLDLAQVRQSATQVQAELSVSLSVPTGTQTLTFASGQGSSAIGLLVGPALPVLSVEPSPLALPPDNQPHDITLRLSNADVVAHQVTLASSDATRFTVSPATLTIAPGQATARVQVLPRAGGFANLTLTSPLLKSVVLPVFITTDFRGVNTSLAMPVGVTVGAAQPPQVVPSAPATFAAPRVGVALGPVLTAMAPRALPVGSALAIRIDGRGIPADARVAVQPADGVQVSVASGQGTRLDLALSVDASAAPGIRRLVVTDAGGRLLPFADPQQSQLRLTAGQPTIASIEPLFATPGTTPALLVRGSNLQLGQLRLVPDIDLMVDSQPQVNADGTQLVARVQVAPLAATGARTVQVLTPSGDTGAQPGSANQFTLVRETREAVTPIASALVGVQVGAPPVEGGSVAAAATFVAPPVGVAVGPFARHVSPQVGVRGTSLTLDIEGVGLQSVTSVRLLAADGVAVGTPVPNVDGSRLAVPLAIDADAPRTLRRVVLTTAGGRMPFAVPAGDQFLVAAPAPRLDAIAPQVVLAGRTLSIDVRGSNFRDVLGVSFDPPGGLLTTGNFTVSADGASLGFQLQVAADADSGPRTLVVRTAGGSSSSLPEPANTFQVARQVGPTYGAIASPLVGLRVGTAAPTDPPAPQSAYAPLVGVAVQPSAQPDETRATYALPVGVVVGSAITGMQEGLPEGVTRGTTRTFTLTGVGLERVRGVSVTGPGGVTAGTPVVNAQGTELRVPVTASVQATSSTFGLRLATGEGAAATPMVATPAGTILFKVGGSPDRIDSVTPIVLEQGKSYGFVVRGAGLRDVYELRAEPAAGLRFGQAFTTPIWSTDAFGERLDVQLFIAPDAPQGSRVIRLHVPGADTGAEPSPSNTVNVVGPQ